MTDILTYGEAEGAGGWTIDLGDLQLSSPQAWMEAADRMTGAFLEAFSTVCSPRTNDGYVVQLTADGRVLGIEGDVTFELRQGGVFRPRPDTPYGPVKEGSVTGGITVGCSVMVLHPGRDHSIAEFFNGMYFHYHSGADLLEDDTGMLGPAYVTVSAQADPWLDAPLHDGRFQDNRAIAALNRPRLEEALRRWEAAVGKPISDIWSVSFPNLVYRYGFRPGGTPDPP